MTPAAKDTLGFQHLKNCVRESIFLSLASNHAEMTTAIGGWRTSRLMLMYNRRPTNTSAGSSPLIGLRTNGSEAGAPDVLAASSMPCPCSAARPSTSRASDPPVARIPRPPPVHERLFSLSFTESPCKICSSFCGFQETAGVKRPGSRAAVLKQSRATGQQARAEGARNARKQVGNRDMHVNKRNCKTNTRLLAERTHLKYLSCDFNKMQLLRRPDSQQCGGWWTFRFIGA